MNARLEMRHIEKSFPFFVFFPPALRGNDGQRWKEIQETVADHVEAKGHKVPLDTFIMHRRPETTLFSKTGLHEYTGPTPHTRFPGDLLVSFSLTLRYSH